MSEAEGTYKNTTVYIWQIKHKSRRLYNDNFYSSDLKEVKEWASKNDHKNLKTRIIKRTVKEDLIK